MISYSLTACLGSIYCRTDSSECTMNLYYEICGFGIYFLVLVGANGGIFAAAVNAEESALVFSVGFSKDTCEIDVFLI